MRTRSPRIVACLPRIRLPARWAIASRDPCAGELCQSTRSGGLCDEFGFFDARGRPQLAGCLNALTALEARSRRLRRLRSHSRGPGIAGAGGSNRLRGSRSPPVRNLEHADRARAFTTFAGCQFYDLVRSAHGILAAAGFSAAALRLAVRDGWMNRCAAGASPPGGWPEPFPDPSVCTHFASHVLRRLPQDFEARYG